MSHLRVYSLYYTAAQTNLFSSESPEPNGIQNSTQNPLKWQHKNTAAANADHKVTNNSRKLILRCFFFLL